MSWHWIFKIKAPRDLDRDRWLSPDCKENVPICSFSYTFILKLVCHDFDLDSFVQSLGLDLKTFTNSLSLGLETFKCFDSKTDFNYDVVVMVIFILFRVIINVQCLMSLLAFVICIHSNYKLICDWQAATQFKNSLSKLMDILMSKQPSYVRCIKPNDDKKSGYCPSKRTRWLKKRKLYFLRLKTYSRLLLISVRMTFSSEILC